MRATLQMQGPSRTTRSPHKELQRAPPEGSARSFCMREKGARGQQDCGRAEKRGGQKQQEEERAERESGESCGAKRIYLRYLRVRGNLVCNGLIDCS